ncbi:Blp family class II bacteriocin [Streptococcus pluranimalium]|uniref:Blp family class II bacteriocin n=1 Tax=Streptococcus pluranimalium TaxID=82348 RepID=UPI0039FDD1CB
MNTKTMEQFNVLSADTLSIVDGGSNVGVGEFFQALGVCTVSGAALGSVVPLVGIIGGAILGAQYCTGLWAIIRTH